MNRSIFFFEEPLSEDTKDLIEDLVRDYDDEVEILNQDLEATNATLADAVGVLVTTLERLRASELIIESLDEQVRELNSDYTTVANKLYLAERGASLREARLRKALSSVADALDYALVTQPTGISRTHIRAVLGKTLAALAA